MGGYQVCVTKTTSIGVDLQILVNSETEMMQIQITGPTSKWFAYGFGSSSMSNTYTVIGEDSDLNVMERTLTNWGAGSLLSDRGTITTMEEGDGRTVVLERGYHVDGTYDFTDLMTCTESSIDIIVAKGASNSW